MWQLWRGRAPVAGLAPHVHQPVCRAMLCCAAARRRHGAGLLASICEVGEVREDVAKGKGAGSSCTVVLHKALQRDSGESVQLYAARMLRMLAEDTAVGAVQRAHTLARCWAAVFWHTAGPWEQEGWGLGGGGAVAAVLWHAARPWGQERGRRARHVVPPVRAVERWGKGGGLHGTRPRE